MRFWRQYVENRAIKPRGRGRRGGVTRWTLNTKLFGNCKIQNLTVNWPEYISNIASRGFVSINWAYGSVFIVFHYSHVCDSFHIRWWILAVFSKPVHYVTCHLIDSTHLPLKRTFICSANTHTLETDRQTDRQADRQAGRQTEPIEKPTLSMKLANGDYSGYHIGTVIDGWLEARQPSLKVTRSL